MIKSIYIVEPITPDKPFIKDIKQFFGLKSVEIKFATYGRINHCNLEVSIYCNETELIHTETINAAYLNDMTYHKLLLNDYIRESAVKYFIEIHSSDASSNNCVIMSCLNECTCSTSGFK